MLQKTLTIMKNSCVGAYKRLPKNRASEGNESSLSNCRAQPILSKKRIASFLGMFLFCAVATFAQSKGAGGFQKAISEVSGYEEPVGNLMKAIAAVIALVGAFNVYFKMSNGDLDVKKNVMFTIGGCVAFIAMSEALPLFFK